MTQAGAVEALRTRGIDLGRSNYARIERGERNLELVEAEVLAQVLGVPLARLLPADNDPHQLWTDLQQAHQRSIDAWTRDLRAQEGVGRRIGRMRGIITDDDEADRVEALASHHQDAYRATRSAEEHLTVMSDLLEAPESIDAIGKRIFGGEA